MKFPVKFDKCPACGSEERLIESKVREEIKSGNLPANARVPVMITKSAIFDPNNRVLVVIGKKFPILTGLYDVCSKCGTLYCTEMIESLGVAETKVNQRPVG